MVKYLPFQQCWLCSSTTKWLAKNLHEKKKKHFVNQNVMNRKNKFNDYQNLRFTIAYVHFQLCWFVQFYHKMTLAKNLHEQKTNSVNIYCVQRGCATKIKGLHTFSVVLIHQIALKKQYDLNHKNNYCFMRQSHHLHDLITTILFFFMNICQYTMNYEFS